MQYTYGSPTAKTERPPCWGKSYDSVNRECKQCIYSTSCREEVGRQSLNFRSEYSPKPPPTAVTYYSQYQPYRAPAIYSAAPPAPVANPVQPRTQPASFNPTTPPQVQQVPQQRATTVQPHAYDVGFYGATQDPLFQPMWGAPAPFRPQLPGETFMERMVKNMGLSMLEAFSKELVLGIRQMILPPPPTRQAKQAEERAQVIDVTPIKK